jgi:carbonic anhydrase/acetyltransferase-like protein (isoleucine patch superfamily)
MPPGSAPIKSSRKRPEGTTVIYVLGKKRVETQGDAYFIAPDAAVIGRVVLGVDANVWFGAVLRGDTNRITIGDGSNVQDNAVIHVDHDAPAVVGSNVTIGHAATVHGCTVGEGSLIGIGATILSHAVIGRHCIVGAHALITERKQFADRSLIVGVPARRIRDVTEEEVAMLEETAAHYVELGQRYKVELKARGK